MPLRSVDAVRRALPDSSQLDRWQESSLGRKTTYLFAFDEGAVEAGRQVVEARYFFAKAGGGVDETRPPARPAPTWGLAAGAGPRLPASLVVRQGAQIGRPSRLLLDVSADGRIQWAAARSISGAASSRSDIGRAKSARAVARAPSGA